MLEGPGIPRFESHGFDGFRERAREHTFKMRSPRSPPGRVSLITSLPFFSLGKGLERDDSLQRLGAPTVGFFAEGCSCFTLSLKKTPRVPAGRREVVLMSASHRNQKKKKVKFNHFLLPLKTLLSI